MRDWINAVEGADKTRLDERSIEKIDVKNGELILMRNPRRSALLQMCNDKNRGWFRGFLLENDDVVVWDAYISTHWEVGIATGLHGRRFEIRSGKGNDFATMLYVPRELITVAGEWREKPFVSRMLPENFHIGPLR